MISDVTNSGPTRSLPDQIADALASDIVHGRLSGGQRLSETALAERFGVSRVWIHKSVYPTIGWAVYRLVTLNYDVYQQSWQKGASVK